MSELINKISSYNFFNYLLPGVIYVVLIENTTTYKILQENMIVNAFLVYFIGLVISRVGSLLIEHLLQKIAPHEEYKDFISACQQDSKIEMLSEVNNMYRTFISLFIVLFCSEIYIVITSCFSLSVKTNINIVACILILLFILSYRKQTIYITKRIKLVNKKDSK
ncbi:MAG: hypothetical protein P8Y49_02365 [Sulfurovaceae bacterium]